MRCAAQLRVAAGGLRTGEPWLAALSASRKAAVSSIAASSRIDAPAAEREVVVPTTESAIVRTARPSGGVSGRGWSGWIGGGVTVFRLAHGGSGSAGTCRRGGVPCRRLAGSSRQRARVRCFGRSARPLSLKALPSPRVLYDPHVAAVLRAMRSDRTALRGAWLIVGLVGCVRVDITPVGTTTDGRRQFEVTCNKSATRNGACDREAREACGGAYETTGIGNTGPSTMTNTYTGQSTIVPGDRVQLITCH